MKAKSDLIDSISETLKNIWFSFILKHQDIQHIQDLFQEDNSVTILSYNEGGKIYTTELQTNNHEQGGEITLRRCSEKIFYTRGLVS